MGAAFAQLAPAVRDFHSLAGRIGLQGQVETEAPQTRLARLVAFCLGTPRQRSKGPIRFELDASPDSETWTRHFPQRVMRSRLYLDSGALVEQLGAARLGFDLAEQGGTLVMQLRTLHVFGMPCLRWLMPHVHAVETGQDRELHFRVRAALPWIGVVAGYRGHLNLATAQRTS
ncbi:DUF4166 domain-containing protein [Polaromonas sp. P2-4]|nr:DUF4166 domain-containing protein [Polaromonas sp. P2-4]